MNRDFTPEGGATERCTNMGVIEVDMFPEDVNSLDHPEVAKFRLLLEQVADDHDCNLLSFEIDNGTVSFSFDNDELTADILKVLEQSGVGGIS